MFLYLIVIGAVAFVYLKEHRTQTALCALRVDVEKRIESSQNFLLENPNGTPGISVAVIRSSIMNSERTVKALSGLTCPQ